MRQQCKSRKGSWIDAVIALRLPPQWLLPALHLRRKNKEGRPRRRRYSGWHVVLGSLCPKLTPAWPGQTDGQVCGGKRQRCTGTGLWSQRSDRWLAQKHCPAATIGRARDRDQSGGRIDQFDTLSEGRAISLLTIESSILPLTRRFPFAQLLIAASSSGHIGSPHMRGAVSRDRDARWSARPRSACAAPPAMV